MTLTSSLVALQQSADLSDTQTSRLLGITIRRFQNLRAGDIENSDAFNQHVLQLTETVMALGEDSASRRAALFRSSDGPSLFHQLIRQYPTPAVIQHTDLTVRDRLGVS